MGCRVQVVGNRLPDPQRRSPGAHGRRRNGRQTTEARVCPGRPSTRRVDRFILPRPGRGPQLLRPLCTSADRPALRFGRELFRPDQRQAILRGAGHILRHSAAHSRRSRQPAGANGVRQADGGCE